LAESELEQWLNDNPDFSVKEETAESKTFNKSLKKIEEPEIDLHGLTLPKAFAKLTRFLREQPQTIKKVRIIHGKGLHSNENKQGILREEIRNFLSQKMRKKELVKDFSYAKPQEGGHGVTIVWLLN